MADRDSGPVIECYPIVTPRMVVDWQFRVHMDVIVEEKVDRTTITNHLV